MKRKLGLVALAAGIVLFAAACGGGSSERLSKDAYLTKVSAVGDTMNATLSGLGDTPSDPKAAAEQFAKLGDALAGAADELAALNPPEEVDAAHKKFTKGIRMLADEIGKAGDGMKGGDMSAALSFASGLASSKAMTTIQEAVTELEKAGYTLSSK